MKNKLNNLLFFIFSGAMLLIFIPHWKEGIRNRATTVTMTDSAGGRVITIIDNNKDSVADVVVDRSRKITVRRPPTEEEQKYFIEHKQKTP